MADSLVVSELLCYLQNYFGNIPRTILCSNVASFYDEAEIVEAKNCLFTWINSANLGFDDVPCATFDRIYVHLSHSRFVLCPLCLCVLNYNSYVRYFCCKYSLANA